MHFLSVCVFFFHSYHSYSTRNDIDINSDTSAPKQNFFITFYWLKSLSLSWSCFIRLTEIIFFFAFFMWIGKWNKSLLLITCSACSCCSFRFINAWVNGRWVLLVPLLSFVYRDKKENKGKYKRVPKISWIWNSYHLLLTHWFSMNFLVPILRRFAVFQLFSVEWFSFHPIMLARKTLGYLIDAKAKKTKTMDNIELVFFLIKKSINHSI